MDGLDGKSISINIPRESDGRKRFRLNDYLPQTIMSSSETHQQPARQPTPKLSPRISRAETAEPASIDFLLPHTPLHPHVAITNSNTVKSLRIPDRSRALKRQNTMRTEAELKAAS